jgi:nucleolar protein 53
MPKAAMSVRANQVNPPKKAKGISKKTKKGWRKNVDITHVEEFLEDQRLEERLGGAFGDRADHDIFTIDTDVKPTEQVDEAVQTRSWRKKREEKPLKCFQHLEITGGVADPKKGRNRRKTLEERKNPTVVAKEITMAKSGIVK